MVRLSRLRKRAEFLAVAGKGRKLARGCLLVQALGPAGEASRLGFTATKKLGNAVVRNRAKRRMRAAARLELAENPPMGFDLVLIARESIREKSFTGLRADLRDALDKLGVPR